ncbi:hypothetical protein [Polynucleobacter sp. MWH-UH25E]|uniref:hypothetical protein n=1 Tax=Polynucleobacter sp. MWH-UH25E TaxID=1855616 RepID=UPI001BFE6521|nr:hypothetical protein [Polynucleobacter sp. MWH-UH25E]QWD62818.1 hypothetical protein ICV39_04200 [Polynucleobacter sp. MWH-UH25E]
MERNYLAKMPLVFPKGFKSAQIRLLKRSPYYWWWQYLRRNEAYIKFCEKGGRGKLRKLYEDFGDVRDPDFGRWWLTSMDRHKDGVKRGAYLFRETTTDFDVIKLKNKSDWLPNWNEDVMIVAINMKQTKREIKKLFSWLLEDEHPGKPGKQPMREAAASSTARYKLHRNFSVDNLEKTLAIYDLCKENEKLPTKEQRSYWEIGESIRLVPSAMPPTDKKYFLMDEPKKRHNTMTMAVSRYYKAAKIMIDNTALGVFPKST